MGVPVSQMWTVTRYVMGQRLKGNKRYPLVLMLEPLFRCNLACSGCGKIQFPPDILRRQLTPEECFQAVEECGAPIVSIPGGEPLLHPQIDEIVDGLIERKKYIYLCTNALLLKKHLHRFKPSKYLSFSIHLDGPEAVHDEAVCREGTYQIAVDAIREAVRLGFRVTTNTTVFNNAEPETMKGFFDDLMELGVEGMMVSPGYPNEKAPNQENFLERNKTISLFRRILEKPNRSWRFNQSPLFLEFLRGERNLNCTPWGNPTYNIFGWQKPCYLLNEGYCSSFSELMETTAWDQYGCESGNTHCTDCMVHSGYEPTAVHLTFNSLKGLLKTAGITLFGLSSLKPDQVNELEPADSGTASVVPRPHLPLVSLESLEDSAQEQAMMNH